MEQHITNLILEMIGEETIEKFANIEHERWVKWQKYFFSKCQIKPQSHVGGMDDRYVYLALPKDLFERWNRQINTPYSKLSEKEKDSDREQVLPYIHDLRQQVPDLVTKIINLMEYGKK